MRRLRNPENIFLVVYLLLVVATLHGQESPTWQPVPKDDLAIKDNPANPGSAAMILERQVSTDDEKRMETAWMRIKVLTEEGRRHADVEIPYIAKKTSIEGIRGRTVRPDGAVIPFDGTVFDKVVVKYRRFRYDVKAFTLPGVDVGSVIEYAYTVHWKEGLPDYVRHPSSYVFQDAWTIPTTTWTIQQELFTRHASFVLRPVKGGRLRFAKVRLAEASPSTQPDGTVHLEVINVPAIDEEQYMPPESMLTSRVHFYYTVGYIGDYWHEFGKLQAEKAAKFIEKTAFLERAANQISPPNDPPETRLHKLYARAQQVRYLSYEPSKTEREVKREHLAENKSAEDIFRHGYGYGNEINFLFTALARAAGFDASIVQVVDRSSALFEPQVWDDSQLNAMVVLVRVKGVNLFLDPASRFCPYGLLPWFESDTRGVMWDKSGGQVLEIHSPASNSSAIERTAELKLQLDGGLDGTVEISFSGEEALDRRLLAADEDEAGRRKLLEDEIKDLTPPGATIDVDSVAGWEDSEQPLKVKGRLHASRFATITEKRILLPPAVFQSTRKRPFIYANRSQPVYLRHGYRELDRITISLPTDYRVEALPAETDYKTSFATFHAKRTGQKDRVELERNAVMGGYYFPVESYGALQQYFEKLRQSDAENVVLHRSEATRSP